MFVYLPLESLLPVEIILMIQKVLYCDSLFILARMIQPRVPLHYPAWGASFTKQKITHGYAISHFLPHRRLTRIVIHDGLRVFTIKE